MGRVLVIGAGGVSTVAVKKIAMNADVFRSEERRVGKECM